MEMTDEGGTGTSESASANTKIRAEIIFPTKILQLFNIPRGCGAGEGSEEAELRND